MSRFIKSRKNRVAYNRDYITYIRIERLSESYQIVMGYAPCNDGYKEIVLADGMNINQAEELFDKYMLELEEEPLQEYLGDVVDSINNCWR